MTARASCQLTQLVVYSQELHQVSAVLDCFQYSQWTISTNNANAQQQN